MDASSHVTIDGTAAREVSQLRQSGEMAISVHGNRTDRIPTRRMLQSRRELGRCESLWKVQV